MANNNKHTGPNVPALRFPEFSEEWKTFQLSDLAAYSKERVKMEILSSNNYVSTENMQQDFAGIKDAISLPSSGTAVEFQVGDILISNIRPYLKKIWLSDRNGGCSTDVLALRTKNEKVDSSFLYCCLANDDFVSYVMSGAKGVKMPRGDKQHILSYNLGVPSVQEQRRIAELVSLLEKRISAQSKTIEDKETLYKAISNILFSHYANSSPTYKLGDLANLYQPETIPSTKLSRGGRYLVYGANGIIGRYDKYNHEESQICLTCRGNTCGNINFSQPYSWITGNAMVINIDNNINNIDKRFLYHYMKNYNFTPFISGSGQPQIVRSTVEKLPVLNVNIQTQKKIASILDSIVMSIDIARKKVDLDQNVKKYLLKNLFI